MAIGVRISSDNLSGQTANVTFLPSTGGTIDLGSKTIPFNNLTPNPYGVYEVTIPAYGDLTYGIAVPAPTSSAETFVFMSKSIILNNYATQTLNFNDFTVQYLNLGVDVTGWVINNIYPITNLGYMYEYYNDNNNDLQWALFVDTNGNFLGQYQANTNGDYDYGDLDGKWNYFIDYYNGKLKYSNGIDIFTYTYDPSVNNVDVVSDYDGTTSDGKFMIRVTNIGTNLITYSLVNGTTITPFGDAYVSGQVSVNNDMYFSGDFIVTTVYDNNDSAYTGMTIYNTSGDTLETIDLTSGSTYNQSNRQFYGDNKFLEIFWNNSDNAVDYLFVHYNGNTGTLKTTTHERGVNYPDMDVSSNTNFYPNNGQCESFVTCLYKSQNYTNFGYEVSYCDFIYMLDGDVDFNTYVFQDSGSFDKIISTSNFITSTSISDICDNGDGLISTISLTESGVTIHSTGILSSGNGGSNLYQIGDGMVVVLFTDNSHTGSTIVHITSDGDLGDIVSGITLNSGYAYSFNIFGDVCQYTNYGDSNYYINATSNLFQSGTPLTNNFNVYDPSAQFMTDFINPGVLVTFNYDNYECSVLTSSGNTEGTVTLPENNGDYDLRVGSDKFMYTFIDTSGFTNINLYDFNFNLLNSLVTSHTSYSNTDSCGNRFVTTVNEDSRYYIYLVSETSITSSYLTNYENYRSMNDYVWWND